nr:MAG: capsid protein [Cressdnaviricota sp.]
MSRFHQLSDRIDFGLGKFIRRSNRYITGKTGNTFSIDYLDNLVTQPVDVSKIIRNQILKYQKKSNSTYIEPLNVTNPLTSFMNKRTFSKITTNPLKKRYHKKFVKRKSNGSTASRLIRKVNAIQKKIEVKYFDCNSPNLWLLPFPNGCKFGTASGALENQLGDYNTPNYTVQGMMDLVHQIVQGTSANTRIGNKINIKSVRYSMDLNNYKPQTALIGAGTLTTAGSVGTWLTTAPTFGYGTDAQIRVLLVADANPHGAQCVLTDILACLPAVSFSASLQTGTNINIPLNLSNKNRFRIIRDRHYMLGPSNPTVHIEEFIKLNNYEVVYIANTGFISSVNTGGLYIIIMSDAGDCYVTEFVCRLRYFD